MEGGMEKMSQKRRDDIEEPAFISLVGMFEKEYFENFINKIDDLEKKFDVEEVGKFFKVDIREMKENIDVKIPYLLERIRNLENNGLDVNSDSSLRDVLGNSIIYVFGGIIWAMKKKFSNIEIPKDAYDNSVRINKLKEKYAEENKSYPSYEEIGNELGIPEKEIENIAMIEGAVEDVYRTQKGAFIKGYAQNRFFATYYIETLCKDDEKLKKELVKPAGYLDGFSEYFLDIEIAGKISKNYPTGSKKLPYFRFFSELEKGNINEENLEEELDKLEEKDRSGNPVIDKDKIRLKFRKY